MKIKKISFLIAPLLFLPFFSSFLISCSKKNPDNCILSNEIAIPSHNIATGSTEFSLKLSFGNLYFGGKWTAGSALPTGFHIEGRTVEWITEYRLFYSGTAINSDIVIPAKSITYQVGNSTYANEPLTIKVVEPISTNKITLPNHAIANNSKEFELAFSSGNLTNNGLWNKGTASLPQGFSFYENKIKYKGSSITNNITIPAKTITYQIGDSIYTNQPLTINVVEPISSDQISLYNNAVGSGISKFQLPISSGNLEYGRWNYGTSTMLGGFYLKDEWEQGGGYFHYSGSALSTSVIAIPANYFNYCVGNTVYSNNPLTLNVVPAISSEQIKPNEQTFVKGTDRINLLFRCGGCPEGGFWDNGAINLPPGFSLYDSEEYIDGNLHYSGSPLNNSITIPAGSINYYVGNNVYTNQLVTLNPIEPVSSDQIILHNHILSKNSSKFTTQISQGSLNEGFWVKGKNALPLGFYLTNEWDELDGLLRYSGPKITTSSIVIPAGSIGYQIGNNIYTNQQLTINFVEPVSSNQITLVNHAVASGTSVFDLQLSSGELGEGKWCDGNTSLPLGFSLDGGWGVDGYLHYLGSQLTGNVTIPSGCISYSVEGAVYTNEDLTINVVTPQVSEQITLLNHTVAINSTSFDLPFSSGGLGEGDWSKGSVELPTGFSLDGGLHYLGSQLTGNVTIPEGVINYQVGNNIYTNQSLTINVVTPQASDQITLLNHAIASGVSEFDLRLSSGTLSEGNWSVNLPNGFSIKDDWGEIFLHYSGSPLIANVTIPAGSINYQIVDNIYTNLSLTINVVTPQVSEQITLINHTVASDTSVFDLQLSSGTLSGGNWSNGSVNLPHGFGIVSWGWLRYSNEPVTNDIIIPEGCISYSIGGAVYTNRDLIIHVITRQISEQITLINHAVAMNSTSFVLQFSKGTLGEGQWSKGNAELPSEFSLVNGWGSVNGNLLYSGPQLTGDITIPEGVINYWVGDNVYTNSSLTINVVTPQVSDQITLVNPTIVSGTSEFNLQLSSGTLSGENWNNGSVNLPNGFSLEDNWGVIFLHYFGSPLIANITIPSGCISYSVGGAVYTNEDLTIHVVASEFSEQITLLNDTVAINSTSFDLPFSSGELGEGDWSKGSVELPTGFSLDVGWGVDGEIHYLGTQLTGNVTIPSGVINYRVGNNIYTNQSLTINVVTPQVNEQITLPNHAAAINSTRFELQFSKGTLGEGQWIKGNIGLPSGFSLDVGWGVDGKIHYLGSQLTGNVTIPEGVINYRVGNNIYTNLPLTINVITPQASDQITLVNPTIASDTSEFDLQLSPNSLGNGIWNKGNVDLPQGFEVLSQGWLRYSNEPVTNDIIIPAGSINYCIGGEVYTNESSLTIHVVTPQSSDQITLVSHVAAFNSTSFDLQLSRGTLGEGQWSEGSAELPSGFILVDDYLQYYGSQLTGNVTIPAGAINYRVGENIYTNQSLTINAITPQVSEQITLPNHAVAMNSTSFVLQFSKGTIGNGQWCVGNTELPPGFSLYDSWGDIDGYLHYLGSQLTGNVTIPAGAIYYRVGDNIYTNPSLTINVVNPQVSNQITLVKDTAESGTSEFDLELSHGSLLGNGIWNKGNVDLPQGFELLSWGWLRYSNELVTNDIIIPAGSINYCIGGEVYTNESSLTIHVVPA